MARSSRTSRTSQRVDTYRLPKEHVRRRSSSRTPLQVPNGYGRRRAVFSSRRRNPVPALSVVVALAVAVVAWAYFGGHLPRWGSVTQTAKPVVTTTRPSGGTTPTAAATESSGGTGGATSSGSSADTPNTQIPVPSFLGGPKRNGYDTHGEPAALRLAWRLRLGNGKTQRKADNKVVSWTGCGWTGQPTVVEDGDRTWILQGAYDHNLRKIDAATGHVEWKAPWPDVIKATNTVVPDPATPGDLDRAIVVSGARRGWDRSVSGGGITPLRAVSFKDGRELWRLPVPRTASYTRDVDASPLWYGGVLYAAVESGYVYALDPFRTREVNGHREPVILATSPRLFSDADARHHPDIGGANIAIEGSPAAIGDVIYVASGSGHVFGLDRRTLKVVWDFKTGSDIDATPVVTRDGHLLVTIEKQYIREHGGVYELDPAKPPAQAVVWYFPLPNRGIGEWDGGSVSSVAVTDRGVRKDRPRLVAFTAVSGAVYVVCPDKLTSKTANGPGPGGAAPVPYEVFSDGLGGSISTPVIAGDSLVAVGYDRRVHLYRITYSETTADTKGALPSPDGRYWRVRVREKATYATGGSIESTPLIWRGRVYVGSRDGYLYCLK